MSNPFSLLAAKHKTPADDCDTTSPLEGSPIIAMVMKNLGLTPEKLAGMLSPLTDELKTLNMRLAQIESNQGVILSYLSKRDQDDELTRRMLDETPTGFALDAAGTAPGVFGGEVGAIEGTLITN